MAESRVPAEDRGVRTDVRIPELRPFVLMAAGAALMIGAVFGSELVRDPERLFGWPRLAIAAFGLIIVLAGLAWFLDPIDRNEAPDEPQPVGEQAERGERVLGDG